MKNKNILVIVHKGYNEFDWLSPIIDHLQIKNNIYFIFANNISYISFVKDTKGERILRKAKKKIIIKKYNFLFFKVLRLVYKKLKIYKNYNFENYLYSKINNIDKICKYLLPKNKKEFDIIFSQNSFTSGWANQFYFNKKKTIVINHPATSLLLNKHSILPTKAKPRGDYMFVHNETEKQIWKKQYEENKIIAVGMPKLNFYNNSKKHFNINKKVVFAYSSVFKMFGSKIDLVLAKQLDDVLKVLSKINDITVCLKIHPVKRHPYYLKILEKYDNNFFSVSDKNLNDLAHEADLLITNLDSSAVLDGLLCKIPTIELWRCSKKINIKPYSFFSYNKLSKHCKNKYELKKYVELGLKFPNNLIWQKQQAQFKKIYGYKNINYDNLLNKLIKKS